MHILLVCSLVLFPSLSQAQQIRKDEIYRVVTMYKLIFTDAGVEIKDGEDFDAFRIVSEMDVLKKAGLDYTTPFKAAGMDSTKVMDALRGFNVAINLMDAGIDWKTSLAILDHVSEANIDLKDVSFGRKTGDCFSMRVTSWRTRR